MDILTSASLAEAIKQCYAKPGYQVGICIPDRKRREDFVSETHYTVCSGVLSGVKCSYTDPDNDTIKLVFKNGSYITTTFHGNGKCDQILYDGSDVATMAQRPIDISETPYEDRSASDTTEQSPLNDFLGGFKVL